MVSSALVKCSRMTTTTRCARLDHGLCLYSAPRWRVREGEKHVLGYAGFPSP
jgi:hypothetical protein